MPCPKCHRHRFMEKRKKVGKKFYWIKICLSCRAEYDLEPTED